MTYSELLQTDEWKIKREQIITRDSYTCQNPLCNKISNPFVKLKAIWDLETYKKKNLFYSHEIDFTTSTLKLFGSMKNEIKFDSIIDESIEISNILIVKYESQIGKFLSPSYWACNGFESIVILNVHHKKYIKGRNPWEYDDEDLITLCQNCHKEVHETEEIPIYNENGLFLNTAQKCDRCNGSGYLPEYNYFQNGVCFRCLGEGAIIADS